MNAISKHGYRWTLITSNISAFFVVIVLIWLAYQLGVEDHTQFFNWTICLLGAMIGWAIGLIITPSSQNEKEQFSGLTKSGICFPIGLYFE
ncbi:membrane protein [Beggiatoa sp. PS]|nr:membrane protein [Beggiatoa sp. PS]